MLGSVKENFGDLLDLGGFTAVFPAVSPQETNPLYYAAVGGLIIGLSTSIHYILKGNVTGMSGIVFGIASLDQSKTSNI